MAEIKPINLSGNNEDKTDEGVKPVTQPSNVAVKQATSTPKKKMVSLVIVLVVLGIATGFGLSQIGGSGQVKKLKSSTEEGSAAGDTFGVEDEKAFTDMAEGEMASGGIDGEGSHHLIREGGESQYVYLTSSIIDLDQFVGKEVKVWGQTFEAQQAGWLMDVGRLQIK